MTTLFVRALIARSLSANVQMSARPALLRDPMDEPRLELRGNLAAEEYARKRWGQASGVPQFLQKAAVGAITSSDPMSAIGASDDVFFSSVFEQTLLGRLQGLREVPFNLRLLRSTQASRGYWVGQSKAIPVSKPALTGSSLARKKVGALILTTMEALEAANPLAEARLEEDMRGALVGAVDEAFLDPSNAGTDEMPAAVTYDAPSTPSSDDPSLDLPPLIELFPGDLSAAFFITDPTTAAQLALARDSVGGLMFPDVGPRGGSMIGIPVLTTRHSPRDANGGQLALVDPTGVAARLESIEMARSTSASIEAADDPSGASDTPVAATSMVNLFQTDSVAFRATVFGNWERQRAAVAVLTQVNYTNLNIAS